MEPPLVSIVIPCYNEERRIPEYLDPYLERLSHIDISYEVVIVDDGSQDQTWWLLKKRAEQKPCLHPLTHWPNRGRGSGVRDGVLNAHGKFIFETDVDASYDVPEMVKFLKYLQNHSEVDVVIATREHHEARVKVRQPILRMIAGKIFHAIYRLFFDVTFRDVMAGCKMYRSEAAQEIFRHQYDDEFLGAAETVFAAIRLGYTVRELPVSWTDVALDTKVMPLLAMRRTLLGMVKMKWRDLLGMYKRRNKIQ